MNAILIVKALLFVAEYLERFLDRAMLRIPVTTGVKSWAGKQTPQKQNGFQGQHHYRCSTIRSPGLVLVL